MLYTLPLSIGTVVWPFSDCIVFSVPKENVSAVDSFLKNLRPDSPRGASVHFASDFPPLKYELTESGELRIPFDLGTQCAFCVNRGIIMLWQGDE